MYMAKVRQNPHDPALWFPTSVAAKLAGRSLPMLDYLCRNGLVEPSCECKRGHGSPRHYSFGDVVALRLVSKLSAGGVSVLRLRKALVGLRRFHPEITLTSLPASHVVTDGTDLYLRREGEGVERVFDGQMAFAFVIELAQLRQEVLERAGLSRKPRRSVKRAAA